MEKLISIDLEAQARREKIRRDIDVLTSTEGWELLTRRQQQLLNVSLWIQARAEKDMLPGHINDPWYFDWAGSPGNYKSSLQIIKRWNCHGAIAGLEYPGSLGYRPPDRGEKFFEANYIEINKLYELEKILNEFGFPAVVHINQHSSFYRESDVSHSFLVLGPGKSDELVVWDKEDYHRPFRVTGLKNIYLEYSNHIYWGVRSLRKTS